MLANSLKSGEFRTLLWLKGCEKPRISSSKLYFIFYGCRFPVPCFQFPTALASFEIPSLVLVAFGALL